MNVFDYLSWRGDLTFLQASFSEVDNLLISLLSYVDLNGIFPEWKKGEVDYDLPIGNSLAP